MVIERGEIWWASISKPRGSEPGYSRPVLIVQSNDFNRSRISTVIAVVITSNTHLAEAPGNVLLSRKSSGLPKVSVANVSQLITIDKAFLTKKIRKLAQHELEAVDAGLQLVLSLCRY
jgi:mRNA interferase MazF